MSDIEEHARIQLELQKATTRDEVLGLALGAASSCWENLEGAGEFESDQAKLILQDTTHRLRELDQPNLGMATTQELITEVVTRFNMLQYGIAQSVSEFLNYRATDSHTYKEN